MKKFDLKTSLCTLFAFSAFLMPSTFVGQMAIYIDDTFGSRFNDINDSGTGISGGAYFDFPTLTWTLEEEATGLASINNAGDASGSMFLDEENFIMQPAYKHDGVWTAIGWFPESIIAEAGFTTYGISPNGRYITGQMSLDCCQWGIFLFDTETGTLSGLFNEDYVAMAAYSVNDEGTVAGWVDDEAEGSTHRIPAYITLDEEVHFVNPTAPAFGGAINNMNGNNMMVGDYDNQPFVYDGNTDTFTLFDIPEGYTNATFTDVSNTGVAIGYCQAFGDFGGLVRDALIYHPDLGSQPLFLKDVLMNNGAMFTTPDGLLGTGYAISPDGNYIAGWVNGPTMFASGWVVYLNDLLFVEPACSIVCPEDIDAVVEEGNLTAAVNYELSFGCTDVEPEGLHVVLQNGLASGAEFPIGTTVVVHHLLDGEDTFVSTCSFNVTVEDVFCQPEYGNVEPISRVLFAGIDNASSVDPSADAHEFFLDVVAEVNTEQAYPITVEGYTGGEYLNFFKAYIDWNNNNNFEESESAIIGSITNSTGLDGLQATTTINVPADAALGMTRMRIVKEYDVVPNEACGQYGYGQAEDYSVMVSQGVGVDAIGQKAFSLYPNPTADFIRINSPQTVKSVMVFGLTGELIQTFTPNQINPTIDVNNLAAGVYFIQVNGATEVGKYKIVKQ